VLSNSPLTSAKQFDIFAKRGKTGWGFYCSVEARNSEEAKIKALQENDELRGRILAVYPKR
jgi:hypothetical protein